LSSIRIGDPRLTERSGPTVERSGARGHHRALRRHDTKAQILLGGVSGAFAGIGVEDFEAQSGSFLRSTKHPTLGRGYLATAYAPMVELLGYLEENAALCLRV
jgi:hypothetical protein